MIPEESIIQIVCFSIFAALMLPLPLMGQVLDSATTIVGRYQAVFTSPSSLIPNNGAVNAPLLGNGNMLAALGGQPGLLQFYINRNDLWVISTNGGGPRPLALLDITLTNMQGASYHVSQDFLHGLTTGQFNQTGVALNLESAVCATNDLFWALLSTTSGSVTGRADLYAAGTDINGDSIDVQLGREQYGSGRWYLNGLLDEARIYNRALSSAEIATLSATQNVSANLIRYWNFDHLTGTTVPDLSGSGANGTVMGGSVALSNGVSGSALSLNGSSIYVDTPVCLVQTGLTVSAFINVRTLPAAGSAQYIFSKGEWDDGWSLGISGGYLRMAIGATIAQGSTLLPTNQWVHVAGTYDGSTLVAYVNGQSVASATATVSANYTGVSTNVEWVERDLISPSVSVPAAAAAALYVVGSTNRTFIVTPGQPVLLVVSSAGLIVTNNFLTNAINCVNGFQMSDLAALRAGHEAWWSNFWNQSFVEVPDQTIMQRYYLSQYVMASASRNPAFPPGLQGWVTTDNPPWHGDYHLNYNFEAPFFGLYAANHIEQADPYAQPLINISSVGLLLGQSQLGKAGIYLPVGMGPETNVTDTNFWGQKSNGSFACVPLAQRWYTTRDTNYAGRVYPFIRDTARFWTNYLTFEGGRYIDGNDSIQEGSANGTDTNSIVSLAFIRLVMNCAMDMSTALNVDSASLPILQNITNKLSLYATCTVSQLPSNFWPSQLPHTATVSNLPIFRYTEAGTAWWANNTLGIQHIYPGNGIGLDSSPDLLQRATNQIYVMNRWEDNNGMNTFYAAAARVGYPPVTILSQMTNMIIQWGWTNGFYNANGGWMENESIVPNTIQEMLMQSQEGVIRFFPCWQTNLDAEFGTLRAYGAFLVSAQLRGGQVMNVCVSSEQAQPCTIQNPWPGQPVAVTRNGLLGEVVSGARVTLPTAVNESLGLTPATGYDIWAQQITNTSLRNPSADADGDGFANLLEYVTGSNPSVADHQSQINAQVTGGAFLLVFNYNTNSTDATIIVERASALTNGVTWVGVATNQSGIWTGLIPVSETGRGNPKTVTVQDSVSFNARFYRLSVTRQ